MCVTFRETSSYTILPSRPAASSCNISGALTLSLPLSTAGTHGHGKRMQGERGGETMKVRIQMRNGRVCGSASTPLKNTMNGRSREGSCGLASQIS